MDLRSGLTIESDLELFIGALPGDLQEPLRGDLRGDALLEVVMDLGRLPEARFPDRMVALRGTPVTEDDLRCVAGNISAFGGDNRAGIERTLHRISAIRNRGGQIVGLTCRVGRAVYGTIDIIQDIVETGKSILVLGRPGIGKTTKLREIARVLADTVNRRVVVVDTSNEIGGDGDIPHSAIGRARRMQVPVPAAQHAVMIEAVENHMPEVIIVDEIGTEEEARAARTIAERGVQLVATAHGNTLENVLMNPTLSDLVGGVQAVTLGDDEARRRGTQKTVLERRAPPTFDIVVEMVEMDELVVHEDVAEAVDALLRGMEPPRECRRRAEDGSVERERVAPAPDPSMQRGTVIPGRWADPAPVSPDEGRRTAHIYAYGISRDRLDQAIRELGVSARVTKDWKEADLVVSLRAHQKRFRVKLRTIGPDTAVRFLRGNTYAQVYGCLREFFSLSRESAEEQAIEEARTAIERAIAGESDIELTPRNSYLRKLQHELASAYQVDSRSVGEEPRRRVVIAGGSGR